MPYIQIALIIFSLFAFTRVVLRYREGQLKWLEFLFWSLIFLASTVIVLFPWLASWIAKLLGIGRGADLIVYTSVAVLFYLIFRAYILIEDVRHEITKLVQTIAINELKRKEGQKGKKK